MRRNPLYHYTAPCTEFQIAEYFPGFKDDPERWINSHGYCGNRHARDKHLMWELERIEQGCSSYARVESIDTATVFERLNGQGELPREHLAKFYKVPNPHMALSFELELRLTQ